MLSTALFDYHLPEELIAQHPAARRDGSRMLVLDRVSGACEIHPFPAILDYLDPGDALIYNDTRVLRGRMYARRNGDPAGAKFELLLVEALDPERRTWNVMLKPGKRATPGVRAALLDADGSINPEGDGFEVEARNGDGTFRIRFTSADSDRLQQRYGHIPLPPYISRGDETPTPNAIRPFSRRRPARSRRPPPDFISRRKFWQRPGRKGSGRRRSRSTSVPAHSSRFRWRTPKSTRCTPRSIF